MLIFGGELPFLQRNLSPPSFPVVSVPWPWSSRSWKSERRPSVPGKVFIRMERMVSELSSLRWFLRTRSMTCLAESRRGDGWRSP